jgi:hypothetical protein
MKIFYEIDSCEECHFRQEYVGIQPYSDDYCKCANKPIPLNLLRNIVIPSWCPFNKKNDKIDTELSQAQIEIANNDYLMEIAKNTVCSMEKRFAALLELMDRKVNGNNHR